MLVDGQLAVMVACTESGNYRVVFVHNNTEEEVEASRVRCVGRASCASENSWEVSLLAEAKTVLLNLLLEIRQILGHAPSLSSS